MHIHVYIIFNSIDANKSVTVWIPNLHLGSEQKVILQRRLWLDDVIINAAQNLLHQQFPNISGLQSTILASAHKGKTLDGGAVQILHIRSNHWVCFAVNEDKSIVQLYDSKYSTIPLSVCDAIIELIHTENETVTIKSMQMQEQDGDDACGVFAIAVATTLCHQEDPTIIIWKQSRMWQHLMDCFSAGRITSFPLNSAAKRKEKTSTAKTKEKKIVIQDIYCICRQRYKQNDKMKLCSKCQKWFHAECLNIPSSLLVKSASWYCTTCL